MTCLQLSEDATLTSVSDIRTKVADVASAAGARPTVVDEIRLCVSEAVTNAVAHGYVDEAGKVDVTVERTEDELIVVIADEGRGMRDFELERGLGYGLMIISKLAKRYAFSSAPNSGTRVRMIFQLDVGADGMCADRQNAAARVSRQVCRASSVSRDEPGEASADLSSLRFLARSTPA